MKTVYLVRHAESEINIPQPDKIIHAESPLSDEGSRQATLLAVRCGKLDVSAIVSSTQMRTRQTTEAILARLDVPVEYSELFIERQLPADLHGKRRGEVHDEIEKWSESYFVDGERFSELKGRARQCLNYLLQHASSRILVVTHGFFMRMMCAYVIFGDELDPQTFRKFIRGTRTDNTGITVLTFGDVPRHAVDAHKERWMVRVYNDHAHLG